MRRILMFSLMAVLTAALVLSSTPVCADDKPTYQKEAVCKTATKTESPKPAPVPEKPAPTPTDPAKPGAKEPVKPDPAPATEAQPAPAPAPEKKEPAAAGALVVKAKPAEKPEPKPAPAATPKPEKPAAATVPPAVKSDEPTKGDPDEEMILIRPRDIAAAVKAASDEGFNAGYAEGVTKSKRYRVMTREEVISLSLKTAREVIEKRLGPKPAKP